MLCDNGDVYGKYKVYLKGYPCSRDTGCAIKRVPYLLRSHIAFSVMRTTLMAQFAHRSTITNNLVTTTGTTLSFWLVDFDYCVLSRSSESVSIRMRVFD